MDHPQPPTLIPPLAIVVMGVAGIGKTTIGRMLAQRMGCTYFEGDDYHSDESIAKMSRGVPLTDEDRSTWLECLRRIIQRELDAGRSSVLSCSALKAAYRDKLREGNEGVVFLYLHAPARLVEARMRLRTGHYFDVSLLESQYAALEEPARCIRVDAARAPEEILEDAVALLARIHA